MVGDIKVQRLIPDQVLGLFTRIGIFTNWSTPSDEALRFSIEQCGFEDLVIGVPARDRASSTWSPGFDQRSLEERIVATRQAGLTPWVMVWAIREQAWLEGALPWLVDLARRLGACPVLDCEPDRHVPAWHVGRLAPELARETLIDELGELPWAVTGLDELHWSVKPLAQVAPICVPQAYSIWKPGGEQHWSHSAHTAPGYQQARAIESWSRIGGVPLDRITMGLGCYWGARPAFGAIAPALPSARSYRIAAAETAALGVPRAWYWALEHIRGEAGEAARAFFGARR